MGIVENTMENNAKRMNQFCSGTKWQSAITCYWVEVCYVLTKMVKTCIHSIAPLFSLLGVSY